MEKEENWLNCLPFKPKQGKKIFLIFAAINIIIIWLYYYKSSSISYYYQSKPTEAKTVPLPIYNVSVYHIPLLQAKDMAPFYAEIKKKTWCFLYGIDLIDSQKQKKCICLDNWFGLDCGIPSAIWKSDFLQEGKNVNIEIRRRDKPRRLISSFVVGEYQDLLDVNIYNSFSVIDLYLTIELSNQKPSVLSKFESGQFAEWQSKIIPFQLSENVTDKVESEGTVFMLKSLWETGWKRLSDFRPDDLLIFQQASSIISKDVLLFLKLYDGYPEPFFFELRPLLFKFWLHMKNNSTNTKPVPFKPSGCTFQYLSTMCNFEISKLLSNDCHSQDQKSFEKNNWSLKSWTVGSDDTPSGWQCNVCCKNNCIKAHQAELKSFNITMLKLDTNSSTVEQFIDKLQHLNNGELTFEKVVKTDPFFAPNVVLNNRKKYSYLVELDEKF